jgi:hypothetical protein
LRATAILPQGEKDSVVPPRETMHLAREIPPERLGGVVVSGAIRHVEIEGAPTLVKTLELVHCVHGMGALLGSAG